MGQVHESWRVYASFIYKPLKKGSTWKSEAKAERQAWPWQSRAWWRCQGRGWSGRTRSSCRRTGSELWKAGHQINPSHDWVPGLVFKAEVQIWRKTERTGTSCCESFFLVAKLDVDKDEGEDGKEEHQVSHLSEQYSLNMEIYANYFSSQIQHYLPAGKGEKHCCDLGEIEYKAAWWKGANHWRRGFVFKILFLLKWF